MIRHFIIKEITEKEMEILCGSHNEHPPMLSWGSAEWFTLPDGTIVYGLDDNTETSISVEIE